MADIDYKGQVAIVTGSGRGWVGPMRAQAPHTTP
jgi:hypothetical protein